MLQPSVNILWRVSISKAFYRVAVELDEATQLCVFILGMWYLYLGVLMRVFWVRYAVFVLVTRNPCDFLFFSVGTSPSCGSEGTMSFCPNFLLTETERRAREKS